MSNHAAKDRIFLIALAVVLTTCGFQFFQEKVETGFDSDLSHSTMADEEPTNPRRNMGSPGGTPRGQRADQGDESQSTKDAPDAEVGVPFFGVVQERSTKKSAIGGSIEIELVSVDDQKTERATIDESGHFEIRIPQGMDLGRYKIEAVFERDGHQGLVHVDGFDDTLEGVRKSSPAVFLVTLAPGISGRVIASSSLLGIADVSITVNIFGSKHEVFTNASGDFAGFGFLDDPLGDLPHAIDVEFNKPGWVTKSISIIVPKDRPFIDDMVVPLEPGFSLAGVVVGKDNAPLEGAVLKYCVLDHQRATNGFVPTSPMIRVKSDSKGQFHISGLEGTAKGTLVVECQWHTPQRIQGVQVGPGSMPLTIRLQESVPVHVKARMPNGRLLDLGAWRLLHEDPVLGFRVSYVTSVENAYYFESAPGQRVRLTARKTLSRDGSPNFRGTKTLTIGKTSTDVVIDLEPWKFPKLKVLPRSTAGETDGWGTRYQIKFRDHLGHAIDPGAVTLSSPEGTMTASIPRGQDSLLVAFEPGRWFIKIIVPGYKQLNVEFSGQPGEQVDVTFELTKQFIR